MSSEIPVSDSNSGTCLIVGASHAGVGMAFALRKEGWQGEIKLIGAESEMPYHRPPLSKDYLAGAKELDGMRLRPDKLYADNNIDLLLGHWAEAIDPGAHKLRLQDGTELHYDKLGLCLGATARELDLGPERDGVYTIRHAQEVSELRQHIDPGRRAVIIGGGYIGLEAAAVLRSAEMEVTVLEVGERVLARVTGEQVSNYITALHEKHGVVIKTNSAAVALQGESRVSGVVCQDGTELPADLVIVGVGIEPNVGLAAAAGLNVSDGIVVNEYAQTSDQDIYAAGDCTLHPSALYQRSLRLESVQNANDQARVAAANICGCAQIYDAVPWFWSDQYDIKLQMAGLGVGYDQTVCRGEIEVGGENGFALFYLAAGKLIAADCIARPKEFMATRQLLQKGISPDPAQLADEAVDLSELLKPSS